MRARNGSGQCHSYMSSGSFSISNMGAKLASLWSPRSQVQQTSEALVVSKVVQEIPKAERQTFASIVSARSDNVSLNSLAPRPSPLPSPGASRRPSITQVSSLSSPPLSYQVPPATRQVSCPSGPRSRAVSDDFNLDSPVPPEQDVTLTAPSECKSASSRRRAFTENSRGVGDGLMHLASVLSQETSTLTVIGKKICVQSPDGRRIVVFQGDSNNTKQVKMLQQICSAVRSLAPEAWQEETQLAAPRPQVHRCCICMEEHATGDGLECGSGSHFVCNSCFEAYVKTQCSLGSKGASATDGSLYCPGRCDRANSNGFIESVRCTATFDSHAVARHTGREIFESYWTYRSRLAEERIAAEMEAALRARAEAEKRQSEVSRARSELAELLTLKCPRCDQAFNDFQGCFALQCGRDKCKACFCGWCFHDCGNDPDAAHRHVCFECVKGRQHNPKDPLFGTIEMFESVCQERRQKLLKEHLAKLDPNLRNEVLEMAKSELAALGLAGTSAPSIVSTTVQSQVTPQLARRMVSPSATMKESPKVAVSPSSTLVPQRVNAKQPFPMQATSPLVVQARSLSPTSLQTPQSPQQLSRKPALPPPSSGATIWGAKAGSKATPVVERLRSPGGSLHVRR